MKAAGAFNGLPRELRWNIRGYIAERNFVAKPPDDLLLTQSSHVALRVVRGRVAVLNCHRRGLLCLRHSVSNDTSGVVCVV